VINSRLARHENSRSHGGSTAASRFERECD
jgi:hypothetical protein